jgi:hypothetical protein
VIVFSVAIAMSVLGAFASLLRGGQFYYDAPPADAAPAVNPAEPAAA